VGDDGTKTAHESSSKCSFSVLQSVPQSPSSIKDCIPGDELVHSL